MIICQETYGCCSILEISMFDDWDDAFYVAPEWRPVSLRDAIRKAVQQYFLDEHYSHKDRNTEFPSCFMATTKKSQTKAATALENLGFTAVRKFAGRHSKTARGKYMTLWIKTGKIGVFFD